MRHTSGMKNNAPVWAINFSPILRKDFSAWKPTPNASHSTTAIFAAFSASPREPSEIAELHTEKSNV